MDKQQAKVGKIATENNKRKQAKPSNASQLQP